MIRILLALSICLLLPPPCSAYPNGDNLAPVRCLNEQWEEVLCDDMATPVSAGVEIAFSPDRGATTLVLKTIESAHTTIRVAAYSFTSKPIAQALLYAHSHGVDVEMVVDKSNATDRYTAATFLANQGIPVRIDDRYAIMHNKFIEVDGKTLETGSFNFTAAAEKHNAENVIVLHDPAVAQRYQQEWERMWRESEDIR